MSDVYDSPGWQSKVGTLRGQDYIVLHYCVDGIPAFNSGGLSIKPAEWMILSLPPALRTDPRNMLLHMLLPSTCKGLQSKKYYDWAASFEVNDLHKNGVAGFRVITYGNTLDTPGRSEMLGLQASTAYQGCPHCYHEWQVCVTEYYL